MDLLFYDIASQSNKSMFISVSGRAYQKNRTGIGSKDFSGLSNYLWGNGQKIGPGIMYGMMTTKKYKLPSVIRNIALDSSKIIIKQSNGLNLNELKTEGYYGTNNRSMMMQWGMEAFTNPIIIRNSIRHIRNTNMFSNAFLSDFKKLNFFLFRWLHLEPAISRIINPQHNGVAIQKGNTYTYKTNDFSFYTVQNYHPGEYADQQHVFGMNIDDHFAIFHNHPARKKESKAQSPNYWVGYGHLPHSVQDKNINLSIYDLPKKKGIMEADLLHYTRAFFPISKFDSAFVEKNFAFGKKENTYCAFIGSGPFSFSDNKNNDIVLQGKRTFWITEAGSAAEDKSFDHFINRIKNNKVFFNEKKLELTYKSNGTKYELKYRKEFKIDNQVMNTEYSRFDSPYVSGKKKDKTITIAHHSTSLFLDFENLIRKN